MDKIDLIENQLAEMLANDKKSWVQIYRLMDQVDQEKLYAVKYKSYTAWVNHLAELTKVHVSLLWQRKKAGNYYKKYEERAEKLGRKVPKMESINVSPDSIALIEKIAAGNDDVADELMEKALGGGMSRDDLRAAWKSVKTEREAKNIKAVRTSRHDEESVKAPADDVAVKAADIVLALNNYSWLPNKDYGEYIERKYKIFTEFSVRTGSSRSARRLDVLAAESCTAKNPDEVILHGIEIKVSKHDLLDDKKMGEYTDFCDYFWLAIPAELQEYALSIMMDSWGLIVVRDGKAEAVKQARYNAGVMRDLTMASVILKLL